MSVIITEEDGSVVVVRETPSSLSATSGTPSEVTPTRIGVIVGTVADIGGGVGPGYQVRLLTPTSSIGDPDGAVVTAVSREEGATALLEQIDERRTYGFFHQRFRVCHI